MIIGQLHPDSSNGPSFSGRCHSMLASLLPFSFLLFQQSRDGYSTFSLLLDYIYRLPSRSKVAFLDSAAIISILLITFVNSNSFACTSVMLSTHFPLFQLAYIIIFLCASVTWAYIPKRGFVTVYSPVPSAASPTLAPAWSPSTPQWSDTVSALPTAAVQSSYVPFESYYPPAPAAPPTTSLSAAVQSPYVPPESYYPPAPAAPPTVSPSAAVQSLDVPPELYHLPASAAPTTTFPPAAYTAAATTCTTYAPCNLFYQYVTVLYWPGSSQKTACLVTPTANPPNPPGLTPQASSLYVIFNSIIASDGCRQIGNTYAMITTSFAPGELSTIDKSSGATQVFDFSDLPCGPTGDNPHYSPVIAPPPFLTDLDPAFATCIPGAEQGIDPPIAIQAADGASVPGLPGHHGRRLRRFPAHASAVPTPV
ncbi:hypothetical protein N7G274_006452 [Stereocaulon virgatum]|uniref:Uncharacterized protein n=1 Tax=Stereocaulon virgatum TaxID=373712 RepID=A0ABR4A506_9LECA